MTRIYRKVIGWTGIAAVLFAQLAVSAFACPMQVGSESAEVTASIGALDEMSSMQQPALCHKHCKDEQKNINDAPSPLASVALAPAFVVTLAIEPAMSLAVTPLSSPLLHAYPPPLSVRNCCFRI